MQNGTEVAAGGLTSIVMIVLLAIQIIAYWKIFTKAGVAGWKALIPIYNLYVHLGIVRMPQWMIILAIIPLANIYLLVKLGLETAKAYGRGTGFALGLIFLTPIFTLILGLDDSIKYQYGKQKKAYRGPQIR